MDLFSRLESGKPAAKAVAPAHPKTAKPIDVDRGVSAPPAPRGPDVDPCARSGDISSGRAKVGDEIVYRALFAGGYYRAKVIAVRFHGGVDIDVFTDSGRRLLHLTRRPVAEDAATCAEGECYLGDLPKR